MSCCGSRRAVGGQAQSKSPDPRLSPPAGGGAADPVFEYVGSRSLIVTGPVTGRRYQFEAPGTRRTVSRHDAASLLYVPTLRHVPHH
jgi:hypothetical protein